jgi:hypothetical protein
MSVRRLTRRRRKGKEEGALLPNYMNKIKCVFAETSSPESRMDE